MIFHVASLSKTIRILEQRFLKYTVATKTNSETATDNAPRFQFRKIPFYSTCLGSLGKRFSEPIKEGFESVEAFRNDMLM